MFASILVPVDIVHESSWRFALPQALALAQPANGRISAIAVVPDFALMLSGAELGFELEQVMRSARSRLGSIVHGIDKGGLSIDIDVRLGSIGHEILTAAEEMQADLIVMESHRPEMKDYLIGPNAAHIARHATCSVVVLRKACAV